MERGEAKIGDLALHNLLGKVVIVKMPESRKDYPDPNWEIRTKEGMILVVNRLELKPFSRGGKLRALAEAAKELAEIALLEADMLDKKEGL